MDGPTDSQYVKAAIRLYEKEGEIEVDEYDPASSEVSRGADLGAYVKAWVWVPEDEAHAEEPEPEKETRPKPWTPSTKYVGN